MIELILLMLMFYLHLIADYNLQGILASMKQKSWWEKQEGYNNFYNNDYIMALFEHSLCWSISINLPLLVYDLVINNSNNTLLLIAIILINTAIHLYIDDLKANQKRINLVTDQLLHFLQIVFSWFMFLII